jgi:hypothetical protein
LQAAGSTAQLAEQQRTEQMLRELATEKGQYRSGYVSDARDAERRYGLEQKAFGLDVAKAEADVQTDRAKLRADRRSKRRSQRDRDEDQALQNKRFRSEREKDAYLRKNKLGPYKPAAPKGQQKQTAKTVDTKSKIRTGVHRVRSRNTNLPGYWEESYKTLVEVDGIDPVVARAIIQGAKGGKIGPKTRKALRDDYGITGLKFGRPKRKKSKPKAPGLLNPFD